MSRVEIAVNTDLFGEGGSLEQIRQLLEQVAEAGFTHIHWCHEWSGEYLYSTHEMLQIRDWMEEFGLKAKGLHATKGSDRDVSVRRVELIQNRVELAVCLGTSEVVLHLYVPHVSFQQDPGEKDRFYACVRRSLDELMPYCLKKGVRICLENLFDFPGKYMLEAWDILFSEYPAEFLGLCYDSGHANMIWGELATDVVKAYGNRLYAVHLHDNDGKNDSHLIPGEGNIQWAAVADLLAGSAYRGPLVLELTCHGSREESLRRAYQAGCGLERMYRGKV